MYECRCDERLKTKGEESTLLRHLKVQTYENKCEVEYAAQKDNEFER